MKDTEEESGEMGNIYISSEQIIQEVQKFRCLYDPADPDHKDRDVVKDAWLSVTQAVVGEPWAKLNDAEKSEAVKQLKRKWKSVRDNFVSHLKREGNPKKMTFIYQEEMSFLLETDHYKKYICEDKNNPPRRALCIRPGQNNTPRPKSPPRPFNPTVQKDNALEREDSSTSCHSSILAPQQTSKSYSDNPDRMFLLSLLPRVSALNSRDKMDFQIGIMQLLQGYETEDINS